MSAMLEELAKAAYEGIPFASTVPCPFEEASPAIRECYLIMARSVLTRLRELQTDEGFRAMIDAVLEGK